ncbi:MAG: DUF6020 family protein [Lachnospiraceae bacterium]|nr:DUF6020 family protein [Lachnospiraceae bacterium]
MLTAVILSICAFVSMWAVTLTYDLSVRSPLTVLLFAACELLFFYAQKTDSKKSKWCAPIFAFFFTSSTVLVKFGNVSAEFENSLFKLTAFLIMASGWFVFFFFLLRAIEKVLLSFKESILFSDSSKLPSWALFLISFAFCVVSYIPWFLYSFPGIMDPDSITQMSQVLGITPYSNHHPVAHTLLISLFCRIGGLFSSDINVRVGFYTFFQLVFFALCASYVIYTLHRFLKLKTVFCFVILAFYSLASFIDVHAILICKDTIFAGFCMLFTCELLRLVYEKPLGMFSNKKSICKKSSKNNSNAGEVFAVIRFILLGTAFCLFRSNGWYAFIMFSMLFLLIFIKDWKKVLIRLIPVFALVLIIKGPVMNHFEIRQPDIAESLHVPEQQIAAVIANDRYLSEEETALLYDVCDISYAKEFYVPWFADNIKELVRAGHPEVISEHKFTYLFLWAKIGLRYPLDYINAWVGLTENVIFPEGDYDVAIIEGVTDNSLGISQSSIIGGHALLKLREILIKFGSFIPLYGFLWSMGSYTWIFLMSLFVILAQKKDNKRIVILLPAITVILTLLLAIPSAKMFRYAFSYAALLPFVFCAFKAIPKETG